MESTLLLCQQPVLFLLVQYKDMNKKCNYQTIFILFYLDIKKVCYIFVVSN